MTGSIKAKLQQVELFWQQVQQAKFIPEHNIQLAYAFIKHPAATAAVVICNGRTECYLKYQEVIFDIYQQGYSVYILDHIGQGLSSRLSANPQQGHIDKFQRYIDHFDVFIERIIKPSNHQQYFLLGNSMGCTIGTLYLQQHNHPFTAAVFCAPMYGIKLPIPKSATWWLTNKLNQFSETTEPNYVLAGTDFKPKPFKENQHTHCEERYQALLDLYQQHPQIRLGSPTNQWLLEALSACDCAVIAAQNSNIPLLILQAEKDNVVENKAQNDAVGDNVTLTVIKDAKHDLFMETNTIRHEALTALFQFLTQFHYD